MELDDRLDFMYWHPKFDSLISYLKSCKFEIQDLSEVLRSPIASGTTPEDYVFPTKGIPFLGARNIVDGKIDLSDLTFIDKGIHNGKLKSSKVKSGDILVTMAGAIGRCAIYQENGEANISQSVARLQHNVIVDPQYLVHYLNSPFGQTQFDRNRHDVNQGNINLPEMGRIKIILPDKEKSQKKIVDEISSYETKTTELCTYKDNIYQQYFEIIPTEMKLSPPILTRDYYHLSAERLEDRIDFAWNHPNSFSLKKYLTTHSAIFLNDIIEEDIDYGINAAGKEKGKIPFVNVENLNLDGIINSSNIRYLDEADDEKVLKENDILISRSRTVGVCSLVTKKEKGFTFGSYILRFRVRADKKVDPKYIVNFINSKLGQAQIIFLQTGAREVTLGGGNNINPHQLRKLMVVIPKTPKKHKIIINEINRLFNIKKEIESQLETRSEKHKKSFQKLLNSL